MLCPRLRRSDGDAEDDQAPAPPVEKPNFGLSGALAKDERHGNMYRGVQLKWSEPADACMPKRRWRLYVFKNDEMIGTRTVSGVQRWSWLTPCPCPQASRCTFTGKVPTWWADTKRYVMASCACGEYRRRLIRVGALLQIADVLTEHESCSKQHAVLQFRLVVVAAAKNVVGSKPKRKVKYVASGAVVDWHTAHGAPLPDRI